MDQDPFERSPNLTRLAILGAALALMLALAMPLVFHLRIHDDSRGRWELLCFIVYLSSLPAFVLAGRRPFAGAMWLLAIGAAIGTWLFSQLYDPFYAALLLTPTFWPADLPAMGGFIFLFASWVVKPTRHKAPKVDRFAHWRPKD